MTTLSERLTELAESAPVATPDPDLWDRGRRYRRRRVGSLVVAGCVLLGAVGLGGVAWHRTTTTSAPVTTTPRPAALPDRVYAPSAWLSGTGGHPPGQLAVVLPAARGSLGRTRYGQLVGVSARTGEYRFLDIPNAAEVDGLIGYALSPDGRHLAYWVSGRVSTVDHDVTVGLGVYDASTGRTTVHRIASRFGLSDLAPENVLAWADDDTLVFGYGVDSDSTGTVSRSGPVVAWNVARSSFTTVPGLSSGSVVAVAAGSVLTGTALRLVDLESGLVEHRFSSGSGYIGVPAVSPGDDPRLALIAGGRSPGWVSVETPGNATAAAVRTRVSGTSRTFAVVSWVDADHVAVLSQDEDRAVYRPTLDVVDVATGRTRPVTSFAPNIEGSDYQVATDLLGRPTVPGVRPASPASPRAVLATIVVLVVLVAGLSLAWWRRRVPV